MRAAITGATGLLGGNLAVRLLDAGHEVVATKRGSSRIDHLEGHAIEWRDASLSDPSGLAAAFEGADVVYHCAAAVSIRFEVTPAITAANVTGTENVIAAVRAAGVSRLVHCSTVGAVGLSTDGQPVDETAEWNMPEFGVDDAYVTTKKQAQDLVLREVEAGLDAVIVNPAYMLGPYDARPSSGALIVNLLKRKVPFYTLGKNNFVDVRAVADSMIAVAEKGRRGELYILGGHDMTYEAAMKLICEIGGVRPPRLEVIKPIARAMGRIGDLWGNLRGRDPLITSSVVEWSLTDRFIFTSDKAVAELGHEIRPIEPAIQSAIDWFRAHGML